MPAKREFNFLPADGRIVTVMAYDQDQAEDAARVELDRRWRPRRKGDLPPVAWTFQPISSRPSA